MATPPLPTWVDKALASNPAYVTAMRERDQCLESTLEQICREEGSLECFCFENGLQRLGLQHITQPIAGWTYREWAPGALSCSLVGDFNGWDTAAHVCRKGADGIFEVFVPEADGLCAGVRYKAALRVRAEGGIHEERLVYRMPSWARCTEQDPVTGELCAIAPSANVQAEVLRGPSGPPSTYTSTPSSVRLSGTWSSSSISGSGMSLASRGSGSTNSLASHLQATHLSATWSSSSGGGAFSHAPKPPSNARVSAGGSHIGPAAPGAFRWCYPRPDPSTRRPLRIYEVHVGISSSEPVIAGWTHFRTSVLPRVVALGYTAVLLMAAQEHAYYGSFGYQVTSFFAPPARFGTPAELQALVDACHAHGLLVLFELVHAHASANVVDGLNDFDGSRSGGYFLPGNDGWHAEWGTRMFDYSKLEVLRFLLAQIAYFATTYRCDGFRFDAVSAALYRHRSLNGKGSFSSYEDYYGEGSELDVYALTYFRLANLMAHELIHPPLVMIAEEHSGLPGLCAPVRDGGVGFDYRQAMGQPPLWIKVLCATTIDGERPKVQHAQPTRRRGATTVSTDSSGQPLIAVAELARGLCEQRHEELRVAYVECHDQSLVGGQSLAFRIMGADMFDGMSKLSAARPAVVRGMALHKLSRLLAISLGGEAYLNFLGNEFGHDGWVDFPRAGNGHSYERARRRWDLADDPLLRYSELQAFDQEVMNASDAWLATTAPIGLRADQPEEEQHLLEHAQAHGTCCDCCEERSLIWFRRGLRCWFGFNFHSTEATCIDQPLVGAHTYDAPQAHLKIDSDAARFGGKGGRTSASIVLRRPGGPPSPSECCTCTGCKCAADHLLATEFAGTSGAMWSLQVLLPPLSSCVIDITGEHVTE